MQLPSGQNDLGAEGPGELLPKQVALCHLSGWHEESGDNCFWINLQNGFDLLKLVVEIRTKLLLPRKTEGAVCRLKAGAALGDRGKFRRIPDRAHETGDVPPFPE